MTTNFLEITGKESWLQGEMQNLTLLDNGFLAVRDPAYPAVYLSAIVDAPAFEQAVICWNATLPRAYAITVEASARLTETGLWSPFGSYGTWSPYVERRSRDGGLPSDEKPEISMNCDIVEVNGLADAIRIRVVLKKVGEESFDSVSDPLILLRRLTIALRNRKHEPIPTGSETGEMPVHPGRVLETPAASQMIRDPEIGSCICNPTTLTVMLADRGIQAFPEQTALSMVDMEYGFGNWAYVMAMGGLYGFRAYARFADFELIRRELDAGRSVGASVSYAKDPETAEKRHLPYLENAPCNTPGHLLTIRGYKVEDGEEYVYVSDSAADSDEEAHRRYKLTQFLNAWSGCLCYFMDSEPETEACVPQWSDADLIEKTPGRWRLAGIDLCPELLQEKEHTPGRMSLMVRQSSAAYAGFPKRMDANDTFIYPEVDAEGTFSLPEGPCQVYLISNLGLRVRGRKG